MVKQRRGSRKGRTKLSASGKRIAKRRAGRLDKHAHHKQHVIHPSIRSAWDTTKSAADNLRSIGLAASVNSVEKHADSVVRVMPLPEGLGKGSKARDAMERHAGLGERGVKQVLRPGERVALKGMYEKYGTEWVKMSRDIKMNYLQWTPHQLEKKVTRMLRIVAQEQEQEQEQDGKKEMET